jgi:hypothetical protein
MSNHHPAEFTADQFRNQNKNVAWLCQVIKSQGYAPGGTNAPEDSVEWLNEILERTDFFDTVTALKVSLKLTDEIIRLRDETADNRRGSFRDLSQNDQQAVIRLNRLILEAAYPRETPACGYELTALIRNRKGDNFLQEYQNTEEFRRDMKEHRDDVAWGLLVRCDRGKVIADYYSDLGDRDKIGPVVTDPESVRITPEGIDPRQAALREAAIRSFKSNKLRTYILDQLEHVIGSAQLSKAVMFLFDDNGRSPALAPIEDIISEREKIEAKIRWLDAICLELRNSLALIKEAEESALEVLGRCQAKV